MNDYILKIKLLLKSKKITQRDFAKELKITQTTVNNYLTGKTKIDIDTFLKIAKVLNVPIGYFFEDTAELKQVDIKEFDKFLNDLIFKNDLVLGGLSNVFSEILERIECGFFGEVDEYNPKFDKTLISSIKGLANIRKTVLFKDDKNESDFEILIKGFENVDINTKKQYVLKVVETNKELVKLCENAFDEFKERLHNNKLEYGEGYVNDAFEKFQKKFYAKRNF